MRRKAIWGAAAVILVAAVVGLSVRSAEPLAVGSVAPGFALTGATRDGVLERPVRLSDFRDQTVVIAFFYMARTKS